mmetsp:Transcript_8014/g.16876  ORF Transcript_8014/g.16876 Transcript_8014/m.16876 type:complete len:216 (+) Transcript_8014:684-1331(+)
MGGLTSDDLAQAALDVLRALHIDPSIDHCSAGIFQLRPQDADPIGGEIAAREAVPQADDGLWPGSGSWLKPSRAQEGLGRVCVVRARGNPQDTQSGEQECPAHDANHRVLHPSGVPEYVPDPAGCCSAAACSHWPCWASREAACTNNACIRKARRCDGEGYVLSAPGKHGCTGRTTAATPDGPTAAQAEHKRERCGCEGGSAAAALNIDPRSLCR